MDLSHENKFCLEAGITSRMLISESESLPSLPILKKGLVVELFRIKKCKGISWPQFTAWVEKICNMEPGSLSVNALRQSILTLESRWGKNRHRGGNELNIFMEESYNLPQRQQLRPSSVVVVQKNPQNSYDHLIMESVNKSLAVEISALKEKLVVDEEQLLNKDSEIKKFKSKLGRVNTRNVNKRIKRKDNKIHELLLIIKSLKKDIKFPSKSNL